MATLKEHQAAMVDLLANGSGIPASASRLAHAMHDVLSAILSEPDLMAKAIAESKAIRDAYTTPGLNDKALSKHEKALKTDSPAKWPTPAEQRVKELENTIRQLKANNAKLKQELGEVQCDLELKLNEIRKLRRTRGGSLQGRADSNELLQEIANLRQERDEIRKSYEAVRPEFDGPHSELSRLPEQAGCRKEDTQGQKCSDCGAITYRKVATCDDCGGYL